MREGFDPCSAIATGEFSVDAFVVKCIYHREKLHYSLNIGGLRGRVLVGVVQSIDRCSELFISTSSVVNMFIVVYSSCFKIGCRWNNYDKIIKKTANSPLDLNHPAPVASPDSNLRSGS